VRKPSYAPEEGFEAVEDDVDFRDYGCCDLGDHSLVGFDGFPFLNSEDTDPVCDDSFHNAGKESFEAVEKDVIFKDDGYSDLGDDRSTGFDCFDSFDGKGNDVSGDDFEDVKPRLNDQTFSSSIVLDVFLLFSRLSQLCI